MTRAAKGPIPWVVLAGLLSLGVLTAAAPRSIAPAALWRPHVRALDSALSRQDVPAARRAVGDAHRMALGSRTWEGMLEVGWAHRRLGEASGSQRVENARAREAFLSAFVVARAQRSLAGLLGVAEAFDDLADREVTGQIVAVARDLAARLPRGEERAQADARLERLASRLLAASDSTPP
jgi:hypothetical protein